MITLEQLPASQVLDAAKPEATEAPEITPIERADRKANARGMRPKRVRNRIKPAAATPAPAKKTKQTKPANQTVAEIRAACEALGLEIKPFGSGSFVFRMPVWEDFKAKLPQDGSAKAEAKLFHRLRDAVVDLTGDSKSTWVFHRTGSYGNYGVLK